jgi:hypothetical protein
MIQTNDIRCKSLHHGELKPNIQYDKYATRTGTWLGESVRRCFSPLPSTHLAYHHLYIKSRPWKQSRSIHLCNWSRQKLQGLYVFKETNRIAALYISELWKKYALRSFSCYSSSNPRTTTLYESRDSWVGIGLDDRGSRVRFPAGAGNFFLHHRVQTGSGTHPASYPMGISGSSPGGKAAVAWRWPLPSSTEVKEWVELCLHSRNTTSWRGA